MEKLLQLWFESSSQGVAFLQPKPQATSAGKATFYYHTVNPSFGELTGQLPQTLAGQPIDSVSTILPVTEFIEQIQVVYDTGNPYQWQQPCGEEQWLSISLIRMAEYVAITIQDISDQKRFELELQQTNKELTQRMADQVEEVRHLSALQQAILKHAGLAIAATDINGIIQLVNPALETLTGYEAEELVGKVTPAELREPNLLKQQIDQLKPGLDDPALQTDNGARASDVVSAFIQKNEVLSRENTLLTKEGKHIPVLSTVSGLYDDQEELIGFVSIATDISYLKTIEQALLQANQRSQLATKAGKLGIWEWDLETNEVILDENFFTLFGIPKSTEISRMSDVEPLVHPNDLAFFNDEVERIIREHKPFDVEFRVISPVDQSIRYIKADGLVLQNEQGISHRMIGVIRDRTAKRQADSALRTSELRYRSLVNQLKEVVFQTDSFGRWIFLNPAWEHITGFTIEESLGVSSLDFIVPEDRSKTQAFFNNIKPDQYLQLKYVVRYIHKAGGFRWIDVQAEINQDNNNQIISITGTLTDITERKAAEEAIQESEQRFREIAENVDEIFWIRDINQPKFLYMNPAFERYSGQSVQSIYDAPMSFANFILEEDRAAIRQAFISNEAISNFQFRVRHQDGSIRWLDARVFVLKNEQGVPQRRIGVATDITTSIEKELILQESLQNERSLNALKSQFISTASHEFRTPLTVINSSIDLVKHYVNLEQTASPLINRHLDTITQKIIALDDLITDTLTISKIEAGSIQAQLEWTDLVSLTKQVINSMFSDREDRRWVEMSVKGYPTDVRLDKKLMSHVLTNLLTNAFKFSTTNPELTIHFNLTEITVSIRDEGIGIPKKDLPHLFGKFFRASNALTFLGTGLGLTICQEYINHQNGHITVSSVEGIGTTFTILLPVANPKGC